MHRVARLIPAGSRAYSHAASLGDGVSPNVKLTPAEKIRLPNGTAVTMGSGHLDTKVHATQLDNGTNVFSKDNGDSIARLTFMFKDGPVYETIFSAGASQFMKHCLNKDSVTSSEFVTKTYLQKAGVKLEQPEIINKSWIAFTIEGTRDTIAQPEVTDKLWQAILFPRFSAATVKEAKRLISLENDEAKRETPRDYVLDLVHKIAYKGSPLGHSLYCPSYNLKYFKTDSLFDRWEKHYGFKNIAVVGTNIDHHDLLHTVQDSIWVARAHQKEGGISATPSKYVGGEGYEVARRSVDYDDQFAEVYETYTGLAFKAPGRSDLSAWAAARVVFAALRTAALQPLVTSNQKKGADVFYKPYKNSGIMGLITTGATAGQLKAVKAAIEQVGAASAEDLEAHKKAAICQALSFVDTRKGCQQLLMETFSAGGFPLDGAAIAAAIANVQPSDVKAVVSGMLGEKATLVHYGDSPSAPTLADL